MIISILYPYDDDDDPGVFRLIMSREKQKNEKKHVIETRIDIAEPPITHLTI